MFLIFINDITNASNHLEQFLFADDDTALISHDNLPGLLSSANIEINKLLEWYKCNKLALHPNKTKCLIFRPNRNNLDLIINAQGRTLLPLFLNLNNVNEWNMDKYIPISLIPNSDESSTRLLGVQLDDNLNFKDHFKQLHGKVAKAVFSLRQIKHLLDKKHLKLLYNSYLKSHLIYASALLFTASKSTIKPILILQKKAIRLVCGVGYREHTAPLFLNEKLLTYDKIMMYNGIKFMFDYKHNLLPPHFNGMWRLNNELHNYPVRNAFDFFREIVTRPSLNKHPLFYLPSLWNSIPNDLKDILSRKLFSRELHSYLLNLTL